MTSPRPTDASSSVDITNVDARLKVLADPTRMKIVAFLLDPVASRCSRDDGVCGCDVEAVADAAERARALQPVAAPPG